MNTYVIGDIHGSYKALIQCLARSSFDYQNDRLIVLGDVCDRIPEVNLCFDELLKIKHCDFIMGNHDCVALDWALKGFYEDEWLGQGGAETIKSYAPGGMSQEHINFLKNAGYYLVLNNKIFVHGGFDPERPIMTQDKKALAWDRTLINHARQVNLINPNDRISEYTEIYIGHTPTISFASDKPIKLCNVWDLDTGAGWGHPLTIMDIETKQYWQSDSTSKLYSN